MSCGCTDVADRAQLVHQLGVDLQSTGGVDDHDVATEPLRLRRCAPRATVDRIGRLGVERHVDALAEHAQLLDRGRALEVGADEQRLQALRLQQARELAGGGRLPGALEAGEHHDGRRLRAHRELAGGAAERLDQLLVDDLDDLLRRARGSSRPRRRCARSFTRPMKLRDDARR